MCTVRMSAHFEKGQDRKKAPEGAFVLMVAAESISRVRRP